MVEDDRALGEILRRGLVEDGYAVDVETTILGAGFTMEVNEYDAVVLDLGLPDGSGVDLLRRMRAVGHPARVLVLTARDTMTDKVAGLDAGADDYLTKPFDFPELLARLRAVLRRPASTRAPILQVGDVRLDPAAHQVWRSGVAVPLTPREFSLLHFLMAHAGDVCRRTDLLEHVWDANYDGLSNVVDVHVGSLRRKLDVPGAIDPIETVRGVGYRMGATPVGATADTSRGLAT